MDARLKKFKYNFIQSYLIPLRKFFLGNKSKNKKTLYPGNPVLFVIGSGRNGSTLLALLLRRHSEIYLPPEQFALPYAIMSWHLRIFQGWKSYCSSTIRSFSSKNQFWKLKYDDFKEIEHQLTGIDKEFRSVPNIFESIFRHYARARVGERRIIGDHSPNMTLFYKTVFREFPKARYIFLIRNPLDVIMSYSKMKDNPASDPLFACWKWNNSIKAYDWIRKKNPANIMLVKYEDLVSNPSDVTRDIQKFLGVDVQDIVKPRQTEEVIDPLGLKDLKYHKNVYAPITKKSVDRWTDEMKIDVYKRVLPIVQENASRFGYDLSESKLSKHEGS